MIFLLIISCLFWCVALKKAFWWVLKYLSTFSSDSSCQLDVFWHDGDPLCVDGAQVGVFEETDEVSFWGFLECSDGCALESQVGLEVLGDLSDQSLEGQLSDEQFGGFLVSSDLTKCNGSWSVSVGFLDSSGGRGALSGSLGGQLFSWSLTSGRFSCSLLCTSHIESEFDEIRKFVRSVWSWSSIWSSRCKQTYKFRKSRAKKETAIWLVESVNIGSCSWKNTKSVFLVYGRFEN